MMSETHRPASPAGDSIVDGLRIPDLLAELNRPAGLSPECPHPVESLEREPHASEQGADRAAGSPCAHPCCSEEAR